MTCHNISEMPLKTIDIPAHLGEREKNRRAGSVHLLNWPCPGVIFPIMVAWKVSEVGCCSVCFTQLRRGKKNLLHDSDSSSSFSAFTLSTTQILHSASSLKQLHFLPPFLHLYFFLMSNSNSKLFLSFIPISDSIQSPAHVLIFLAELYSVNAFVSLSKEQKYLQASSFPSQTA